MIQDADAVTQFSTEVNAIKTHGSSGVVGFCQGRESANAITDTAQPAKSASQASTVIAFDSYDVNYILRCVEMAAKLVSRGVGSSKFTERHLDVTIFWSNPRSLTALDL
jgi:hypothetical protein